MRNVFIIIIIFVLITCVAAYMLYNTESFSEYKSLPLDLRIKEVLDEAFRSQKKYDWVKQQIGVEIPYDMYYELRTSNLVNELDMDKINESIVKYGL